MKKLGILWLLMVVMMLPASSQEDMLTSSGTTTWRSIPVYDLSDKNVRRLLSLPQVSIEKAKSDKIKVIETLIKRNSQGRVSGDRLRTLATAFVIAEEKFGTPAFVLQAIAFVESSYVLNAINSRSNDFGIMQVNDFNIRAYGFDKEKLLTDLQYSINAGAQVFEWFYSRYPLKEAISRYNCGTSKRCPKWSSVRNYLYKIEKAM